MIRGILIVICLLVTSGVYAGDEALYPILRLESLIEEGLKYNHEILMMKERVNSSRYRIPQSGSPPEPMVMVGYENEGWSGYTYGEMPGTRWIFSISQMLLWPGKLETKRAATMKESESLELSYEKMRLDLIKELKDKFYELLYLHKGLEAVEERITILDRLEEIAISRYSTGIATLSDVTMVQTERYMAMEEEVMFKQKIRSIKTMINPLIGRQPDNPLGIPEELVSEQKSLNDDELMESITDSPDIMETMKLLEAKEYRYRLARLEYYPDITLKAEVSLKPEPYEDMWMVSASFNIPIFYKARQRMMVLEARSEMEEVYHNLGATEQMIKAEIIDILSMIRASEELIRLYSDAIIPKAEQGLEAGISAYRTGKVELMQVIKTINSLIDYRLNYWRQVAEREKALARLERLIGREL